MRFRKLIATVSVLGSVSLVLIAVSSFLELTAVVREALHAARIEVVLVESGVRSELIEAARENPGAPLETIAADRGLAASMRSVLGHAPSVLAVGLIAPTGEAVAHTREQFIGAPVPRYPELPAPPSTGEAARILRRLYDSPPTYQYESEILMDGSPFATIRVDVAGAFLRDAVREAARRQVFVSAAILIAAVLIAVFLDRIAVRRIRTLEEGILSFEKGDFDVTLPEKGIGEFGRLAHALNRLGERIRRDRERGGRAGVDESRTVQEIGNLAAGAAHEMGNHLQGILANVDALRRRDEIDPAFVRENADQAAEGLLSLDRVVGGFLKLARIRPLAPELIDPDEFLRTLHGEMKTEASLAGVELVVEAGAGGRRVIADRDVLGRAVGNLVRNALQAMDEKGSKITLRSGADGERVRIVVADDGPGMPEEVAAKAFDLHFTTRNSGSGLGLAMVRQAALRHGGKARIRSKPGEGTEVALELPAAEGGAVSGGTASAAAARRAESREGAAGRAER